MSKVITPSNAFSALDELLLGPAALKGDQGVSARTDLGPVVRAELAPPRVLFRESVAIPADPEGVRQSVEDDFDFSRKIIQDALIQGQQMVETAVKEAAISGHPRSIEAAQQALKTMTDAAKDLLALHKTRKEILMKDAEPHGDITVHGNATIVSDHQSMSTLEMLNAAMTGGKIDDFPFLGRDEIEVLPSSPIKDDDDNSGTPTK